jgi:hypothetical protein
MNRSAAATLVLLLVARIVGSAPAAEPEGTKVATPAFSFADTKYFHRWSKDGQHEFTPAGQEDLEKWTDMVTIWQYPDVKDGEALAKQSNAVLDRYKTHGGFVLRTNSVPRTKDKPAEHYTEIGFTRPTFREIDFARFKIHDGMGAAIVYSHRIYGDDAREKMQIWTAKNFFGGPEKSLMQWNEMPKLDTLK